ncbi:hypothetical protein BDV10DRAFT_182195 [Aspergillus recurvatus]
MAHVHIPPVSLEDLQAFQAKHFPATLKPLQSPSLPTHDAYNEDPHANADKDDGGDEDDDLGYYPDGVKRTLTDEQIRIFRHSEIHALLRERQIKQENEEYEKGLESEAEAESQDGPQVHAGPGENKDGGNEVTSNSASPKNDASAVSGRKRPADEAGPSAGADEPASKRKSSSKSGAPSDVHLDYNEENANAPTTASQFRGGQAAPQFMGRRIISYDD